LVISLDSQNQDYLPDLSGPTGNCQKLAAEFRVRSEQGGAPGQPTDTFSPLSHVGRSEAHVDGLPFLVPVCREHVVGLAFLQAAK
jgi:hypothetical protein